MDVPPLDRTYLLENKATSFRLEVYGGGPPQKLYTRLGGGNPWQLLASDVAGCYRLMSHEGEMLDSNADREVYSHAPNDGNYQKWRFVDGGDGYWCLHNLSTGLALDSNDDKEDGQGWAYTMRPNDGSYQRWKFLPTDPW